MTVTLPEFDVMVLVNSPWFWIGFYVLGFLVSWPLIARRAYRYKLEWEAASRRSCIEAGGVTALVWPATWTVLLVINVANKVGPALENFFERHVFPKD